MIRWPIIIRVPLDPWLYSRNAPTSHDPRRASNIRTARARCAKNIASYAWVDAGRPKVDEPVTVDIIVYRVRKVDEGTIHDGLKHVIDGIFSANRNGGYGVTPDDGEKWVKFGAARQETGRKWLRREAVEFRIQPRKWTQ